LHWHWNAEKIITVASMTIRIWRTADLGMLFFVGEVMILLLVGKVAILPDFVEDFLLLIKFCSFGFLRRINKYILLIRRLHRINNIHTYIHSTIGFYDDRDKSRSIKQARLSPACHGFITPFAIKNHFKL
jgi:hypothetical protein